MDIQAEISLLTAELNRLRHPGLIAAMKQLLKEWQQSDAVTPAAESAMVERALEAERDFEKGNYSSWDEFNSYLDDRFGK